MKKIISLFQRNHDGDRLVRDEVTPGAEWVLTGVGKATRKWDGTCCMIQGGRFYKRYEVKRGKKPPVDFLPANDVDSITGKQHGWVPVGDGPEDKWHRRAFNDRNLLAQPLSDAFSGTYELCGPMVQGNPECLPRHILIPHGISDVSDVSAPRTFDELAEWFQGMDIEGVVWHHPDGRMVKIKAEDFGIKRNAFWRERNNCEL